ncbi:MAG TPA: UV DNA damage repair endonuclease UvsE [Chthoniobacterales bacterium]|nr:UV DNA damage repair endonuclease UvsE [Chthoniobacterales bacterium]
MKVLGAGGLKSNDTRRWQQKPHLRVSLRYLDNILDHLEANDIRMYRMSSDLAPYVTHPDMPQFHGMIEECADELKAMGKRARALDVRLSFHPSQFIVLNSPDPVLVQKSVADLAAQTEMLDRMELGSEAVVVVHAGGTYGDTDTGCARWVETYKLLSPAIRRRLVLENDDLRYSAADVLKIHRKTGVPLIFDHQHFWCHNPEQLDLRETVEEFVASWPKGVRPKIHFSSPRTELRQLKRKVPKTRKKKIVLQPPIWTGHADFCQPFEFISMMRLLRVLEFDVMIEAKSKDLALMRLRRDLQRYAPDVAERFGLDAVADPGEEPKTIEIAEAEESW